MFGLKKDWSLDLPKKYYTMDDYNGGEARWCPGCGDFAVLTAVQRVCREEQLAPEKTVCVSGIGCSSRFPHYMKTYGFHGLHGRAFPVACGVKSRRPDLNIFVATGDGDCCSIGAGHWVHAIRYNMDMTVMLFDNNIYGLTKKQTSPTTPQGLSTNTHPDGAWLPPLNVLAATLGLSNLSFMAQTVDWNPTHLYETLKAAQKHRGLSFVRILQRCPAFVPKMFEEAMQDPDKILFLEHENGIPLDAGVAKIYKNRQAHDPTDLIGARTIADDMGQIPIGLLYHNPSALVYDDFTTQGMGMSTSDKIEALNRELDRFAIQ